MSSGEYVVYNGGSPPQDSIDGAAVHLNYIARIVVSGAPHSMRLPTDREVAGFRRPWISDKAITGQQSAVYGILLSNNQVLFTIDGKSFDMQTARELKLGDVDEWTIQSKNDVGFVTHPFHIHVNPFEVTSIVAPVMDGSKQKVDGNGKPVFQELLKDGPVWRDTVKIPGGGWVKMRTKYERFTGTFVQHCHILDHEDQGMMQLIDIYDKNKPSGALIPMSLLKPAPVALLPDANGTPQSVTGQDTKPTVLFFIRGEGCAHCTLQVAAFRDHIDEFRRLGMQVIGVTSDNVAAIKAAFALDPSPFPILADPKGAVFAKYGCASPDGILHGTFILDGRHRVIWRTVGASPYLAVQELLRIGQGLATTAAAQPQSLGASRFARAPAAPTNH